MAQPPGQGQKVAPQNDLYTALLMMAAGLLLFGVIYLAVRCTQLFDSVFPAAGG